MRILAEIVSADPLSVEVNNLSDSLHGRIEQPQPGLPQLVRKAHIEMIVFITFPAINAAAITQHQLFSGKTGACSYKSLDRLFVIFSGKASRHMGRLPIQDLALVPVDGIEVFLHSR